MADEASVRTSLQVKSGNLEYQSQPTAFLADVTTAKGPTPGAITVAVGGTSVDLSQLTRPALCRVMNLDDTNYLEVGVWDVSLAVFYPLLELLPGESYVVRLSRNLSLEEPGTGSGTAFNGGTTLRLKAHTAACVALVECFDA